MLSVVRINLHFGGAVSHFMVERMSMPRHFGLDAFNKVELPLLNVLSNMMSRSRVLLEVEKRVRKIDNQNP